MISTSSKKSRRHSKRRDQEANKFFGQRPLDACFFSEGFLRSGHLQFFTSGALRSGARTDVPCLLRKQKAFIKTTVFYDRTLGSLPELVAEFMDSLASKIGCQKVEGEWDRPKLMEFSGRN
jgi:hypothetical protein